ncbi:MAG: PDGLE domain-containing protein [Stackebrandtia sp.]
MKRKKTAGFVLAGLLVSLLLASVVSSFGSESPDGLNAVSAEGCEVEGEEIVDGACVARGEREHEIGGPFADYSIAGVDNPLLSTGIAGVIGVAVVFGFGAGVFWLLRSRVASSEETPATDGE